MARLFGMNASAALLLCLLASCTAGSGPNTDPQRAALGFGLRVLPDCLTLGAGTTPAQSRFSLSASANGSQTLVSIHAEEARGLKALYCDITYDAASYAPLEAKATDVLALGADTTGVASADLLELPVLSDPGVVHYGAVLAHWPQRAGFNGSGVLAVVKFRRLDQPPAADLAPAVPARQASDAPVSDLSQTTMLWKVPGTLHWRYYCQGDYDQNGEVNVSDLTPLGAHFGQVGPFDPVSDISCIDGDGNGELNIADLTPLGSNFGKRVGEYSVFESTNVADYPASNGADNGAGSSFVAGIAFTSAIVNPGERKLFELTGIPDVPGQFYWARVRDGSSFGTSSNLLPDSSSSGNIAPVAAMFANPSPANVGDLVHFDAGASSDADGTIVDYQWDVDGVAGFEADTLGVPTYDASYAVAGPYLVSVQVQDDGGLTNVLTISLTINAAGPAWHTQAVAADANDAGSYPSLAEVDGVPAISYRDVTGSNLNYIRADDAQGASWTAANVQVPDNSGLVTGYTSMEVVSGFPAIAYNAGGSLWYVRASNADGTIWGTPVPQQIDTAGGSLGSYASLAIVGGQPAVGYFSDNDGLPKYIRSDSGDGTSWLSPSFSFGAAIYGQATSLAEVDGLPALSCVDGASLVFQRASSIDGSGAWSSINPATSSSTMSQSATSLLVVDGMPAIAYCDTAIDQLMYIRASDADGTFWGLVGGSQVDPTGTDHIGKDCSMAIVGGVPAISYNNNTKGAVFYVSATDVDGNAAWNPPVLIDDGGDGPFGDDVGYNTSLAEIAGTPCIAYYDLSNGDLKFAAYY